MTRSSRLLLFSLLGAAVFSVKAQAQEQSSLERGAEVFQSECSQCHADAELESRLRQDWTGQSAEALLETIATTMPGEAPGSLSPRQYRDVTSYVLDTVGVASLQGQITRNDLADVTIELPESGGATQPWASFHGGLASRRYSPLEQINADNVDNLEIAWRWRAANFGPSPESTYVTSPLMVNDTLYATAGATRNVVAIDPESGQTLWMYRPEEGERFQNAPRQNSGKGLSYWSDGDQGIIFYVTPGYQLIALDAETGDPVESFADNGKIDLKEGLRTAPERENVEITWTFPPTIINDVIVVGAGHGVSYRPPHSNNVKGDVRAFDAETGEHLWTFHTIPEKGEFGYDTWHDDSARNVGNGGVWTAMSADPELGLVYLPVESATGDRYGGFRPGRNLFTGSVVALDYRTGERVWHFQHLRHDIWDYDTPSAPILADLPDGREVLVQLTKQSFAYVLDRETGEPIWEMEDRPVPQTDVPGEWTASTQPFPTRPPAYDNQGFTEEDLINFTPEILQMARDAIEPYRLGPLYAPASVRDAEDGSRGTMNLPGTLGGSNWEGGAYDPDTGMLYIPSQTSPSVLSLVPGEQAESEVRWIQGPARTPSVDGLPIVRPPWGRITKMDLNEGDIEWQIPNADTPDYVKNHDLLEGVDVPRTGKPTRAGLLLTRTLLFAGEGQGGGPVFRAHDKQSGEILTEIDLPASQTGQPITYMYDGQQYIVMAVSGSGASPQLVALTLPN